ncbi:hypothetical protein ABFX02_14G274000 [Erythranthe guttata]
MLLRGDLGLLCSLVAVVLGWLFVRRKLRRAAARRDEVRRLMAFASEEAARVEREAAAIYRSYGSPLPAQPIVAEEPIVGPGSPPVRQLQYQCEVCFSPTTTRCKQCKAVRYCSRRCQIFHWRQGHKDECHSFSSNQNGDAGAQSDHEEFKQNEIQSSQNVIEVEVMDSTKPVELSSREDVVSDKVSHVLDENNDTETEAEASHDLKKADINVKARVQLLPDESSPSAISKDTSVALNNLKDGNKFDAQSTMNVESIKPLLSEQPTVTSPGHGMPAVSVSNQLKSDCIDIDEKSESSTSSGCNDNGSEEHLLSEPSSPSFDFWGGKIEPVRSKINQVHEDDVSMLNSRSSLRPSSDRINGHVEMLRPDKSKVLVDYPSPAAPALKESIAVSEVSEDGLKPRGPQSLAPKHLDREIGRKNGSLDTLKRQQNDSSGLLSSEARFSSSAYISKPSVLDVESVKNERLQGDASCSLGNGLYARSASARVVDQRRASNFIRHGSLGAGSGKMGRYEGSFPYDVFVKLYHWNEVELCPFGLLNCGNSCYANAVLQCLAFTPPLTAYFLQGLHAKSCRRKEWCFTCEFEALVEKAMETNYPLSPARIMSRMQNVASHLGNGREEDAHEFLRYAIDAMQNICLKEAGVNAPGSLDEETTLMGLTFGGYLQSKIKCMRCGGKSKQHEKIMDLTIEIGGQIGTLEDALRQFTHSEVLDGENKYHCGRCNSYEKAKKKLTVLEAPNVLTIALKRFQSGKFGKLNKPVKFPEILNLATFMSRTSDKSPIYQLYGVLVHLDVSNATFSGHYVCYIKNNQGRWFKADDSVVQPVEVEKVLSKDAYMLFYARCSPRAPKPIRESIACHDPIKPNTIFRTPHQPVSLDNLTPNVDFFRDIKNNNTVNNYTRRRNLEESSSECSSTSSSFFSESESNSTESSNRGSVSTNDEISLDQSLGVDQTINCWSRQWRGASDSDSSPSQSSSSSSPLCMRRSRLAELGHYSERSGFCSAFNVSSNMDGDRFRETGNCKERVSPILCSSNKVTVRACRGS